MNSYHRRLLEVIHSNINDIEFGITELANKILSKKSGVHSVWLIGNGGSASTVEHFETDLAFARVRNLKKLPSISVLTTNSALTTAVSNDTSYEDLFKVLLERKAKTKDLLITISASGNSKNIINAVKYAKNSGIDTFSLLGFDGGETKTISDQSILIKTNLGEFGVVEDIHLSICHAVSAEILRLCTC